MPTGDGLWPLPRHMWWKSREVAAFARFCVFGGLCVDVTICTSMVILCCLTVFWLFLTIRTLYQSSKTLKITGVPTTNRHRSTKTVPTVYQRCTKRQKQSKTVKRQSKQLKWGVKVKGLRDFNGLMGWVVKVKSKDSQNSKNDHWCTNRHMSTKTVPTVYQLNNVPIVKNSQNNKNEGLRLRG